MTGDAYNEGRKGSKGEEEGYEEIECESDGVKCSAEVELDEGEEQGGMGHQQKEHSKDEARVVVPSLLEPVPVFAVRVRRRHVSIGERHSPTFFFVSQNASREQPLRAYFDLTTRTLSLG